MLMILRILNKQLAVYWFSIEMKNFTPTNFTNFSYCQMFTITTDIFSEAAIAV